MHKDDAMPQTVLLIHDDGTKAQVVKDALIDTREGFFLLEWVERCSEAVQRLRRDGKEHIAAIEFTKLIGADLAATVRV